MGREHLGDNGVFYIVIEMVNDVRLSRMKPVDGRQFLSLDFPVEVDRSVHIPHVLHGDGQVFA